VCDTGCVAQIRETRFYGASRPVPDAPAGSLLERRPAADGTTECRAVSLGTATMREVTVRRSFAGDAQEANFAMAALLGGGVGVLAYGQDHVNCPERGGGCSVPTKAAWALVGLSAIPLGFLVYNAIAVQDRHGIEVDTAAPSASPWAPCAAAPSPSAATNGSTKNRARVDENAGDLLQAVEEAR
jgi:hypothetical protein